MSEDTRTVHQRMVAIIDELPAIGKNQRNTQQNFNFRGHDDVLNALTPLLAKHGVVIVPDVLERVTSQRMTAKGSVMYEVNLHIRYTFYGAAGDSIAGSAWGEGTDMGDKATMKAGTMAFKALLNQAFAINTEEGAAHDTDKGTVEETVPVEKEQVTVPRTWEAIIDRAKELLGEHEAMEWLQQAKELKEMSAITPQPTLLQRLAGAVADLTEAGHDYQLMHGGRETVRAILSARLDGCLLDGPDWCLDGEDADELARPSREEVLSRVAG